MKEGRVVKLKGFSFICWADKSWKKIIAIVIFNYGSFSKITIPMYQPTSHCSNSLSESHQANGPQNSGKMYSIATKVAKDPERYFKLQSHVPEQNNFIGKQCYSVFGPLFDE
ncbi:hypothetical protein VP01_10234g1, partial [Puccinia sorghi]